MNKTLISILVVAVVVGAGAFYGGMQYGKSSTSTRGQFGNGQFIAGPNGMGGTGMRAGANGGGFTAGEIISKDESSIIIKMQDGSTKIVLISSSTQVMKTTDGSLDELTMGTDITVTGMINTDGSLTAQSVQIRPTGSLPFGGSPRTDQ